MPALVFGNENKEPTANNQDLHNKPLHQMFAGLSERMMQEEKPAEKGTEEEPTEGEETKGQEPAEGAEAFKHEEGSQPATHEMSESEKDAEIKRLRHELASANGRLLPTQQRLSAMSIEKSNLEQTNIQLQQRIAELESVEREVKTYRKSSRANEVAKQLQDEYPDMDPQFIQAFTQASLRIANDEPAQPVAQTQQQHKPVPQQVPNQSLQDDSGKRRMNALLQDGTRNVGLLPALVKDANFINWVNARPEVGMLLDLFVNAASVNDADALANRLDLIIDRYNTEQYDAGSRASVSPPTSQAGNNGVQQYLKRTNRAGITRAEYERRRKDIMTRIRSSHLPTREKAIEDLNKLQAQYNSN